MPDPSVPPSLSAWVEECDRLTRPDRVAWCDGSQEEYDRLVAGMLADGTLLKLDAPGCTLHRSHPSDVARSENLTFICTESKDDAGPTNNWMSPRDAEEKLTPLFRDAMKGRTLYVVPYLMGPVGSPYAKIGVQITDSPYVVANLRIMTRMGRVALERLRDDRFVRGLHSLGDLDPSRRFVCHFPERNSIWSIGSGYGGNALLPKKCFALRIAGWLARQEGWLAEHMLILGLEDPRGEVTYIAAAFPSACGKTNLAMLVPPESQKGWKVWTVGDDIAWMHFGPDGRLHAINPEAGFFAVAPGTSTKTNPNMMATVRENTIFTNVALTKDGQPWWEGKDGSPPAEATDWQGRPWRPDLGTKAAHPNSRMTAPARQCPGLSPRFDDPQGVPISAIIFGGRRARLAPLVFESFDWRHGVFLGASMGSETTAAATGQVGVTRRDPMAMIPFCGYNMADYFRHWLKIGTMSDEAPSIFHVNWFRTAPDGSYLWPGFGENVRVLRWILGRCRGEADAVRTPIGYVPTPGSLDLSGLGLTQGAVEAALAVHPAEWRAELGEMEAFFRKFGDRLPEELWQEHERLGHRLEMGAA